MCYSFKQTNSIIIKIYGGWISLSIGVVPSTILFHHLQGTRQGKLLPTQGMIANSGMLSWPEMCCFFKVKGG